MEKVKLGVCCNLGGQHSEGAGSSVSRPGWAERESSRSVLEQPGLNHAGP